MANGCIVARVLPLRCFLFVLPNYIHICAIIMCNSFHIFTRWEYGNKKIPSLNTPIYLLLVGSKAPSKHCE